MATVLGWAGFSRAVEWSGGDAWNWRNAERMVQGLYRTKYKVHRLYGICATRKGTTSRVPLYLDLTN